MICWEDFKIYKEIFVFCYKDISQFVNSCLFDACFNRTGIRSIARSSIYTCAATADFSISAILIFLTLVSKSLFVFPMCVCVCARARIPTYVLMVFWVSRISPVLGRIVSRSTFRWHLSHLQDLFSLLVEVQKLRCSTCKKTMAKLQDRSIACTIYP
jgi:hypothetical protein